MFLYFTNQKPDPKKLGIEYAFEGKPHVRQCREGPSGMAGNVFADPSVDPTKVGYFKAKQTWKKMPGINCWVGYYQESELRPSPENLARKSLLNGYTFELGDGNDWVCPVARDYINDDGEIKPVPGVPTSADLDDDGNWIEGQVIEKYAELWNVANRWFDHYEDAAAPPDKETEIDTPSIVEEEGLFDVPDENDGCVVALQANYRIGKVEAAALKLLNDQSRGYIFLAMAALPRLWQLKKKEVETIENGSAGAEEGSLDTDLVSQTS